MCNAFQAATLEGKVWLCPLSSHALSALFERGQRVVDRTPPCTMKAIKNETEIQGKSCTHIISYMYWHFHNVNVRPIRGNTRVALLYCVAPPCFECCLNPV